MCCGVAFRLPFAPLLNKIQHATCEMFGLPTNVGMSFGSSVRGFCSLGHIVVTCKKVCTSIPILSLVPILYAAHRNVALTSAMPCLRVQPASCIKAAKCYTLFVSFQPISTSLHHEFQVAGGTHVRANHPPRQLSGQFFLPSPGPLSSRECWEMGFQISLGSWAFRCIIPPTCFSETSDPSFQ